MSLYYIILFSNEHILGQWASYAFSTSRAPADRVPFLPLLFTLKPGPVEFPENCNNQSHFVDEKTKQAGRE